MNDALQLRAESRSSLIAVVLDLNPLAWGFKAAQDAQVGLNLILFDLERNKTECLQLFVCRFD